MSITKFDTGAIRDTQEGKVDFIETISWTAFNRYAKYMTGKKTKYGTGNFKKGIPIESYEQSLLRHVHKYLVNKYERGDEEIAEDHLSAIVFNVFGIMHEEEQIKLTPEEKEGHNRHFMRHFHKNLK
jgi:hypothetical protein